MKNNYNYISKAPCGKDLFIGKAHQKTAKQIAQRIFNAKKSLMIGIEGSWGSGKSNLITMIEMELKELHKKEEGKAAKAIFFNYDVWGHQNDMLRRSILEELTNKVIQSSQTLSPQKRKEWKQQLKDLMSQKRETSTKTIPKISMGVLVFALMTAATPTFSELGKIGPEKWAPCWNIFVPALPLLLGLIYVVIRYIRSEIRTPKAFLNELLAIYQERVKENVTHEVIFLRSPAPPNSENG